MEATFSRLVSCFARQYVCRALTPLRAAAALPDALAGCDGGERLADLTPQADRKFAEERASGAGEHIIEAVDGATPQQIKALLAKC